MVGEESIPFYIFVRNNLNNPSPDPSFRHSVFNLSSPLYSGYSYLFAAFPAIMNGATRRRRHALMPSGRLATYAGPLVEMRYHVPRQRAFAYARVVV